MSAQFVPSLFAGDKVREFFSRYPEDNPTDQSSGFLGAVDRYLGAMPAYFHGHGWTMPHAVLQVDSLIIGRNPVLTALALLRAARQNAKVAFILNRGMDHWPYGLVSAPEMASMLAQAFALEGMSTTEQKFVAGEGVDEVQLGIDPDVLGRIRLDQTMKAIGCGLRTIGEDRSLYSIGGSVEAFSINPVTLKGGDEVICCYVQEQADTAPAADRYQADLFRHFDFEIRPHTKAISPNFGPRAQRAVFARSVTAVSDTGFLGTAEIRKDGFELKYREENWLHVFGSAKGRFQDKSDRLKGAIDDILNISRLSLG